MLVERCADIFLLVVDGRIKTGRLDQPFAFLVRTRDANNPAALNLGDLANHRADSARCSGNHHGFARLRLGNIHQAEIGGHAGGSDWPHEGRERDAGKLRHLGKACARQRVVERPMRQPGVHNVAWLQPVKTAFGDEAEAAAAHGFAQGDRREISILIAHPDSISRIEREVDGARAHFAILKGRKRGFHQFEVGFLDLTHRTVTQHPGLVHLCHRLLPFFGRLR